MEFNMSWKLVYLIVAIVWYLINSICAIFYSDDPENTVSNTHSKYCMVAGAFWPLHIIFVLMYIFKINKK